MTYSHALRRFSSLLKDFYDNLAGEDIVTYDEYGTPEIISFAKSKERVTKDSATNSHKVIDKLARAKGNVNMLSIVHIDELIKTSVLEAKADEHSHQWLDENGWDFRKTYIQDRNGDIYETTLNIAKTRDGRNILYALSNTNKVDVGEVPSTHITERGSRITTNLNNSSISQSGGDVNSKFSLKRTPPTEVNFGTAYLQNYP
ncbi:MAG: hypothetical protein PUD92_08915 [Clostridiales bacterium]|nr:hypothetical protein [Clostridiales bacterium]